MNFFGKSSSKGTSKVQLTAAQEQDIFIESNFKPQAYIFCIENCLESYMKPLNENEKTCLAQCTDLAHDRYQAIYHDLATLEKNKNPF